MFHPQLRRALLVMTVALASATAGAATASASSAIGTPGLTVTATGPLTMVILGVNFRCTVSIAMTLERTIVKTAGSSVLAIQPSPASTVTGCTLGYTGTFDRGGTTTYLSFLGALPLIAGVNVATSGLAMTMRGPGLPASGCSLTIAATGTLGGTAGTLRTAAIGGTITSGTSGCPRTARLASGTLTLGLTVTLTLV